MKMKKCLLKNFIGSLWKKQQNRTAEQKKSLNWNLVIGSVLITVVLLMAVVGLFYTPYPVNEMNVLEKNQAPSFAHLFGTDQFGRDIFSRVMEGASTSFLLPCGPFRWSGRPCPQTGPGYSASPFPAHCPEYSGGQ